MEKIKEISGEKIKNLPAERYSKRCSWLVIILGGNMAEPQRPRWVKDKVLHKDFELIKCKSYDDYKDHKNDNGCYVLIKVDFEFYEIQVAICNYKHEMLKVFKGKRPQDIYNSIFEYEKKHNLRWFTEKQHIAYLGKELKKAEIALVLGNTGYYQE